MAYNSRRILRSLHLLSFQTLKLRNLWSGNGEKRFYNDRLALWISTINELCCNSMAEPTIKYGVMFSPCEVP